MQAWHLRIFAFLPGSLSEVKQETVSRLPSVLSTSSLQCCHLGWWQGLLCISDRKRQLLGHRAPEKGSVSLWKLWPLGCFNVQTHSPTSLSFLWLFSDWWCTVYIPYRGPLALKSEEGTPGIPYGAGKILVRLQGNRSCFQVPQPPGFLEMPKVLHLGPCSAAVPSQKLKYCRERSLQLPLSVIEMFPFSILLPNQGMEGWGGSSSLQGAPRLPLDPEDGAAERSGPQG